MLKLSQNKYRTGNPFNISSRLICTITHLSNHRGKLNHCRFPTIHHDRVLPNTEIFTIFLVRQNEFCPEIEVSGHQNDEK